MKVYKLTGDFDKYNTCNVDRNRCQQYRRAKGLADISGSEMSLNLDGKPLKDVWWPRTMMLDDDPPRPVGDYVYHWVKTGLVLERRAIETLKPIMGPVEVLPLICDFGDYWAVNVLTTLDCVDYETSRFVRFQQRDPNVIPRIMYFEKYAFFPEKIVDNHIFRIPDQVRSVLFVDDVFVSTVKQLGITGFDFTLVWEG